ncbi:hypothetical protein GCM10010413_06580 [Promicromonospora sukumoe]
MWWPCIDENGEVVLRAGAAGRGIVIVPLVVRRARGAAHLSCNPPRPATGRGLLAPLVLALPVPPGSAGRTGRQRTVNVETPEVDAEES